MRATWAGEPIIAMESAPAALAVTLDDVKGALRISFTDQDDELEAALNAAIDHFDGYEGYVSRALINQEWSVAVCGANCHGRIFAPLTPCQAITEIEYYDTDGILQTATLADFRLTRAMDYAYVTPETGKVWPTTQARQDAIKITFRVGYGPDTASIPNNLKHAIRLTTGHYYEHREASTLLDLKKLPFGVDALVAKQKLWRAA